VTEIPGSTLNPAAYSIVLVGSIYQLVITTQPSVSSTPILAGTYTFRLDGSVSTFKTTVGTPL